MRERVRAERAIEKEAQHSVQPKSLNTIELRVKNNPILSKKIF